jgi:molecular chaperone Hsp33
MNDADIEIRTYFARGKNALVARGDFSELYASWYLHRLDYGIDTPPEVEDLGRDALAAVTLHCASRPWGEACAWTIKFPIPRANIFAAGDNNTGSVVARVVTDDAAPIEKGMFYSDVVENMKPPRRSAVDFQAGSVFEAVEIFYDRSEQRPVRFFRHDEEDIVMIAAQPDCDLEWLRGLTNEGVQALDRNVELSLLEKRQFTFSCGCNQGRMLDFIAPVFRREAEGLFGGDTSLTVTCPRCGARHVLTREALEAWCAQETDPAKPDTL